MLLPLRVGSIWWKPVPIFATDVTESGDFVKSLKMSMTLHHLLELVYNNNNTHISIAILP